MFKQFRIGVFLLFVAVLLAHRADALAYTYIQYSTDKGLQDRRTFATAKDDKGYLWIATRTSIDRFDGENFVHYLLPTSNDNERIRGVVVSPDKSAIFAITNKCVYRHSRLKNCFEQLNKGLPLSSNGVVREMFFDRSGNIIILTNEGIFTNGQNAQEWIIVEGSANIQTFDIAFTPDGELYLATIQGVNRAKLLIDKRQASITNIESIKGLPPQRVQTLYFDHKTDKLWIGSFTRGVYLYNRSEGTTTHLNGFAINVPVREISPISEESVWIATDGLGIVEYSRGNNGFSKRLGNRSNIDQPFTPNNIYHILCDGPIVWVCSYSNGLFAVRTKNITEKIYRFETSNDKALTQNHVNAILEDSDRNLWFATNGGVFYHNNTTGKTICVYDKAGESNVFLSLFEDSRGVIWAAGYSTKVLNISPKTLKTTQMELSRGKKDYHVYAINEDTYGNIWLGSAVDSLTMYRPKEKTAICLAPKGVYSILPLADGSILTGGIAGMHKISSWSLKPEFIDMKNSSLLRNPFIYNMTVSPDNSNKIWFTTDGQGLCCIDMSTMQVESWNTSHGFSSDYLYGLIFDRTQRLWVSSENGLNCFNPSTKEVISLFENMGLPSRSFNFSAFARRSNGNMLWGSPNEAIEIDPLTPILRGETKANLRFSDFSALNVKKGGSDDSQSYFPVDDGHDVTLAHDQNTFSIEFINLNQIYGEMAIYRWKLDGVDKDWVSSSSDHKAAYNNVHPGTYRFTAEIVAQGSHEILQQRTIDITIRAPFYATWWALLCYVIIGISIAYFIYRYYANLIETRRSDEKIRFFINMAHDIRTPITLIKAPLNELEQEELSDGAKTALGLALSNVEKLMGCVTQLLDFQKLERKAMSLQVEESDLNAFVYNAVQTFFPIAKQKHLNLTTQLLPEKIHGFIDQPKLALILENLLSNALKYSYEGGNVVVKMEIKESMLVIEVMDEGIGIPQSAHSKIFTRFYRAENASNSKETGSGIGLMLIDKLVTLHKGSVKFVSNPKCGTIFTVTMPYRRDDYSPSEIFHRSSVVHSADLSPENQTQEYSVLIVEDNNELRSYLSSYLRKKYRVFEAENGEMALNTASTQNLDLIISDVMMPVVDGFEMCRRLKERVETSHIPIVLLTSLTEREEIIRGLEIGAEDYISKPFDLLILETKIDNIIRRRSLLKQEFVDNNSPLENDAFSRMTETDRNFLTKLYSLIEENMADELYSVDKMAYDLAMSYPVFYRKIKVLLGITPKDLVTDIKMKRAAELIRGEQYGIGEIAYLVGFPNAKYFSTAFKKYFNVSPSSFNNHRE